MEIKTKYSIGDKVWFKHNDLILEGEISSIAIKKYNYISYRIVANVNQIGTYLTFNMEESKIFPTKEELLKSL